MSSHGASVRKRPSAARLSILYHLPANRTPRRVPLNPRGTSGRSSSFFTPVVAPSQGTGGAHPNMVRITALAIVPPHTAKYACRPPSSGDVPSAPHSPPHTPDAPARMAPRQARRPHSASMKARHRNRPALPATTVDGTKGRVTFKFIHVSVRGPFRQYSYTHGFSFFHYTYATHIYHTHVYEP